MNNEQYFSSAWAREKNEKRKNVLFTFLILVHRRPTIWVVVVVFSFSRIKFEIYYALQHPYPVWVTVPPTDVYAFQNFLPNCIRPCGVHFRAQLLLIIIFISSSVSSFNGIFNPFLLMCASYRLRSKLNKNLQMKSSCLFSAQNCYTIRKIFRGGYR